MTVFSNVEVLEDWFQVNSLVLHCCAIFLQNGLDVFFFTATTEVLSSGKECV
jgi:hypothetical protein